MMKEFGICKSCKFWKAKGDTEVAGLRTCSAAIELWEAASWDDEYENFLLHKENKEDGSFVQDEDSYGAALITQGTFGCNEFKGKE